MVFLLHILSLSSIFIKFNFSQKTLLKNCFSLFLYAYHKYLREYYLRLLLFRKHLLVCVLVNLSLISLVWCFTCQIPPEHHFKLEKTREIRRKRKRSRVQVLTLALVGLRMTAEPGGLRGAWQALDKYSFLLHSFWLSCHWFFLHVT